MTDADASASLSLQDDALSAGLDALIGRFAAAATAINARLTAVNTKLAEMQTRIQTTGAMSVLIQTVGASFAKVANGVALVVTKLPLAVALIKKLPEGLAPWMPKLKQIATQHDQLISKIALVGAG